MNHIKKILTRTIMLFLILSMVLAAISMVMPLASAAGPTITLSPSQAVAGSSVTVTGTGFAGGSAVGIGFGAEVKVNAESASITSSFGGAPYTNTATLAKTPTKPSSLTFTYSTSSFSDDGAGTITGTGNIVSATMNYATSTVASITPQNPWQGAITASYTSYANSVTPVAGITTNGAGSFTANFTVPAVSVGNYTITAIDSTGNLATNTLSVSTQPIPETLSIAAIMLLSVAVVTGSLVLGKRPKIRNSIRVMT